MAPKRAPLPCPEPNRIEIDIDILAGLPEHMRRRLWLAGERRTYRAKEIVQRHSRAEDVCYAVPRGSVRCYVVSKEGQELTLRLVHARQVFDLYREDARYPVMADALESGTVVLSWPWSQLEYIMTQEPGASIPLIKTLRAQIREDLEMAEVFAFRSVQGRVAHVLAHMADVTRERDLRITRGQLATHVAAGERAVNKALRCLADENLLQFSKYGRVITILDLDRLMEY